MPLAVFGVGLVFAVLNFIISWWNAIAVGLVWNETKAIGGWPRVVTWAGAVMSASGFTWVFVSIIALIGGFLKLLPLEDVSLLLQIGYAMVIIPILGSGLILSIQSIVQAYRDRSFANIAVAGWNSFAMMYNTANAIRILPMIFKTLGKLKFTKDTALIYLIVIVTIFSAGLGSLLTRSIVLSTARKHAQTMLNNKPKQESLYQVPAEESSYQGYSPEMMQQEHREGNDPRYQ